jgi:hypothetical protein
MKSEGYAPSGAGERKGNGMSGTSLEIALRNIRNEHLEEAAKIAEAALPRAHTYASENADLYYAQDAVRDRIVGAIRAAKR